MRIAYFDAFSGLSGDMTLGALVDLGVPLEVICEGIAPLRLPGVSLSLGERMRSGITARKVDVHIAGHAGPDPGAVATDLHRRHGADDLRGGSPEHHGHTHHPRDATSDEHLHAQAPAHDHAHRPYREIRRLLADAGLADGVRTRALRIFHALAVAEGRVHGVPPDDVWFHEVGSLDAIADVVGTAVGLDFLGIEAIYVSPLPLGSGFARSQHGTIPIPAPATLELLRGFAVRPEDGNRELVTPTGAAILAALATPGPAPDLTPLRVGWGAGERELHDRPNLLRVILADTTPSSPALRLAAGREAETAPDLAVAQGLEHDEMVVLEANVDDMIPEHWEPALAALTAAGARDVSLSSLWMKKDRPGVLLRVIAEPAARERLGALILTHTSTIGVRSHTVSRLLLPRSSETVATGFGPIRVKVVTLPGGKTRVAPEADDCREAAGRAGVAMRTVYDATLVAASRGRDGAS